MWPAFAAVALFTTLLGDAHGEALLVARPMSFESLAEFKPAGANWKVAGGLSGDPRREKTLQAVPGAGLIVNVPTEAQHDSLVSTWEHGDLELDVDFLLPAESNSGVYLQGRYEVQLFDSWGVKSPKHSDCGGIYERWDASRPEGRQGFGGYAPKANGCRAPGLWQHLHVEFRAPRFDASGKKTSNGRFVQVALNGFVVQENVEVEGVTRGSLFKEEAVMGPLLIQGDHGAIALRNLAVKRFGDRAVAMKDVAVKFYEGTYWSPAQYDKKTAKREAAVTSFADAVTSADGRGAAVFTGKFEVPSDGEYAFEARGVRTAQLTIAGQTVILPNPGGRNLGRIRLKAGVHPFRLDQPQGSQRSLENFSLWCEGPGVAPQRLGGAAPPRQTEEASPLPLEVADRVLVQRTFTAFEGAKRIYTAAVGSPTGTHYTYDLEAATVLRVWRGEFLDAASMWSGRGNDQTGDPMGPALTLSGKPLLAQFADGELLWPARPAQTAVSKGYRLNAAGEPTFLYSYVGVALEDRITAREDARGLTRSMRFTGAPWERNVWVLIAEGSEVSALPGGGGYVIGDREFYIDWPKDAALKPVVRTQGGISQLVVSLPPDGAQHDLAYTLVW